MLVFCFLPSSLSICHSLKKSLAIYMKEKSYVVLFGGDLTYLFLPKHFCKALIPRMDATSSRYVKYQEIWGYCFPGQGLQECS